MKSVLISIKPKDCKLIANGKMTIKVLKSRPKIETPFKVYIYCALDKKRELFFSKEVFDGEKGKWAIPHVGNGKVIGEFICNKIYTYYADDFVGAGGLDGTIITEPKEGEFTYWIPNQEDTCLRYLDIKAYGKGKTLYGWHVSNLQIHNKPKELNQFSTPCKVTCENCKNPLYFESLCKEKGKKILTRPPYSWCYISED